LRVRIHPISLALRYLKGQRTMRCAPFRGRETFENDDEAIAILRKLTGQDFGTDAAKWGKWLRHHRRVYYQWPVSTPK
jgi:hypothetical protein